MADNRVDKEDAESYIRQKENLRILGFLKFHLWLYNMSSKKKEEGWMKRIGEKPVIYEETLTQRSNQQMAQYFRNRGYHDVRIENQIEKDEKKRKIDIKYVVQPGEPYIIRNIDYHLNDPALREIFFKDTSSLIVRPGRLFDYAKIDEERTRLTILFRNNGYYDFGKEMVYFLADTILPGNEVDLDMYIKEEYVNQIPYYINDFEIRLNPISFYTGGNETEQLVMDTIKQGSYTIISEDNYSYNPGLFTGLNRLKKDSLYKVDNVQKTFYAFSGLNQFRSVNILFRKDESIKDTNRLNCIIDLVPMKKQSVSFDVEGTNTSGNFGVAGTVNYLHRNLFHNAEVFRLNLKGAIERQQWIDKGIINDFDTRELGIETSLTFPKLLGPGIWFRYFDNYLPKTVLALGFNYQDRPDYTRTIANMRAGYNWKTSESVSHMLNFVDFNMVDLYAFDAEFINSIQDLYIKSSFTDHLILSANYSFTYNTQTSSERKNYEYVKFSFESAGNLLNLFSSVTGSTKYESSDTLGIKTPGYYEFLNTRYAQYVKADFELRYGYYLDRINSFAGRFFAGIGIPYGNFDVLPFEKKYFTGGANGLRAWQVRSLGPGTYKAPANSYPNQSSDIKLEANIEYRYRFFTMLEGALFLDVGNIWSVNGKDNREGAKFEINKFYNQIAIGTGTGFRFDFSYFIFRLDIGMKLRDPSQALANGWIIGNRKLNNDDFNFSFAIGYPF
jgi:outer membrane protein assembly factor BamA